MSPAIFGLILGAACIGLGWKHGRGAAAVVAGILLGLVLAASGGPFAKATQAIESGLQSGLDSVATAMFQSGGK